MSIKVLETDKLFVKQQTMHAVDIAYGIYIHNILMLDFKQIFIITSNCDYMMLYQK